ncbi:LacI family DNA-binding transcriptional regulator [Antribacter gilvus]|uniref:LacI family DNA-binding transcriptional regulator n=1 Tax=Antribacter gilvus TaxID=2304675 RepID=UPI000F77CD6E|nr:LacI family DNA-binding transcriptional regulator [Antribacter gilvus]
MVSSSRPNDPVHPHTTRPDRRPTIVDVARAAGVSTAVVSYALNGRPGVSASTRERVLRVADELGWRPATAARSLRSGPAAAGLVLVHDGRNGARAASALDLVVGAQEALGVDGPTLAVHVAPTVAGAATLMETWWTERRYAAFVVPHARSDDARLAALRRLNAPAVVVGEVPGVSPPGWRHVSLDDAAAFARLGSFLADLGHTRVAMLAGSEELLAPRRRTAALRAALGERGASLRTVAGEGADKAAAAVRPLLSGPDRPTAIVTDDDATAGVVLDVARRLGLSVPWDLSVVAGTDAAACHLTTPSLTAVPFPVRELGLAVGAALLDVLGGDTPARGAPTAPGNGTVAVGNLVVRGSTAPPPS